ncbi:MAG TPA: alpha/beta fold hydrolase [Syntrophomonadaceae bacterium]|nr:alpha/beta fold hydrolase [Syntrophomonadaceae bacterium]HQA07159.1 alpha/beta fold hydrolase [Syntrophomonadaceae bacterium]HQE23552.1 alpha/beta fold hydrolase [Syntrophomonadaceae bacterium]
MIYIHPQAEPFYIAGGSSKKAVLLIHGFTASPSEMYPLAETLREKLDCTVSGILLPGHGSHPRFLNRTTWKEWFNAVQGELEYLLGHYEQVYAVGLSMGGLLAIYAGLCMHHLCGVVSINAPIINRFQITNLAPVLQWVCPYFPKPKRQKPYLQGKKRFAYDVYPLKALSSMLELRQLIKKEISKLNVPTLLIQSQQDETVASRSLEWLSERITQAPLAVMRLEKSGHIATMGPEQELLASRIAQFINS